MIKLKVTFLRVVLRKFLYKKLYVSPFFLFDY